MSCKNKKERLKSMIFCKREKFYFQKLHEDITVTLQGFTKNFDQKKIWSWLLIFFQNVMSVPKSLKLQF